MNGLTWGKPARPRRKELSALLIGAEEDVIGWSDGGRTPRMSKGSLYLSPWSEESLVKQSIEIINCCFFLRHLLQLL